MTLTDSIFGPLRGTPDVEFGVLNTLEAWLPVLLRVLERRHDLPAGLLREPPGRSSYVGGIDLDNWQQDICPMIIAACNPAGEADRSTDGYGQAYQIEIAAVIIHDSEDEARIAAGHYGTAITGVLAQDGSLGGIASHTTLVSAPILEFVDPEIRRLIRSRALFQAYIPQIVDDFSGAHVALPPDSPQYGGTPDAPFSDAPAHTSTNVNITIQE